MAHQMETFLLLVFTKRSSQDGIETASTFTNQWFKQRSKWGESRGVKVSNIGDH